MNNRLRLTATLLLIASGCTTDQIPSGTTGGDDEETTVSSCDIPVEQIFFGGVGRDGIPALSNPEFVEADAPEADYLLSTDRVIGLELDGQWLAIPHNVLWYHEVVNLDVGDTHVVVSYCPLTGSSLVFDRSAAGDVEFGVSGLLFNNNLIMFDRSEPTSLWPQMSRRARCGPLTRKPLPMVPAMDMQWQGWKELHPDTRVLRRPPGFGFRYTVNPLGPYEADHDLLFFPMPTVDNRLPAKERVVGVPQGSDGGTAYPFSALGADRRLALHLRAADGPTVVLWDGAAQGAGVYLTSVDGVELTMTVQGDRFVDEETGSVWTLAGRAVSGSMSGQQLAPFPDAFVSFWFAWAAFQPETVVGSP